MYENKKIIQIKNLQGIIEVIKSCGKKIVFTNGCFDILHVGHTRYLAEAKSYGDILIVGINSDKSVRLLKGIERPINCTVDRVEVLAALEAVDYVVVFDELTAERIVSDVSPDFYVKGGDYKIENLPEAKIVAKNGGKTIIVSEVEGKSSTDIIQKINRLK